MATEMWAAAAAVLLSVAAGGSAAALAGRGRRWLLLSVAARGTGVLVLAVAVYVAATGQGGWSPLHLRQMALGLALATALAHLVLSLTVGPRAGSFLADAVGAALVVAAWMAIRPGGDSLTCVQRALPYWAEWALFLLGAGGVLVAGSVSLALALPWLWARAGVPGLLTAGTFLGVLAIGAGIVSGLWWAWQAGGTLEAGDIRESWMAVVWLLAAMSAVAWQLEKQARRWAAGLALAAAGALLVGLLALPQLQRLVGG